MRARPWIVVGVTLVASVAATPAHPDSVVLQNGGVIRADRAWIDGDRVVFEQLGGLVGIPRAIVLCVIDDEFRGPRARPAVTRPTASPSAAEARGNEGASSASPRQDSGGRRQQDDGPAPHRAPDRFRGGGPHRGADVASIAARIAERRSELEGEIAFLERAHTAFFFSHRSTTDVGRRIGEARERLARLNRAARDPQSANLEALAGPEDRGALLQFLDRAHAAFLFSHRSTAEVTARIRAAREFRLP